MDPHYVGVIVLCLLGLVFLVLGLSREKEKVSLQCSDDVLLHRAFQTKIQELENDPLTFETEALKLMPVLETLDRCIERHKFPRVTPKPSPLTPILEHKFIKTRVRGRSKGMSL